MFYIQIRKLGKNLLLQLVSQDALARLKASKLGEDPDQVEHVFDVYFHKQKHGSFVQFLEHYLDFQTSAELCILEKEGVLVQVLYLQIGIQLSVCD